MVLTSRFQDHYREEYGQQQYVWRDILNPYPIFFTSTVFAIRNFPCHKIYAIFLLRQEIQNMDVTAYKTI